MIDRICISINNRCNLACRYCHFHEKGEIEARDMDVLEILDHVKKYAKNEFKIGFVGNGECFLDWTKLKYYISYLEDCPAISVYTITNGMVKLPDKEWLFLEDHKVNVGFSIDGYRELHNLNRCDSFDRAMENVENYKRVTGHYPTFNATVGRESLDHADRVIEFFKPYGTRVTFSRMIGKYGISLKEYRMFLDKAERIIPVRRGGKDCTMYGGQCGAGLNNYFFANGKVYFCGNCINLPPIGDSGMTFDELEKINLDFDRSCCCKETLAL
ncbi:MAG: radical SAM protein [Lachnospiraceae bacterium]|nr:radical SAM protein [Lachnospiraceae bacterium]